MNDKRIIITGASGFIGSNLIKKLIEYGFDNILALDIKENPNLNSNIEQIIGDFSDTKILASVLKKGDIIIHLACPTIPSTSEKYLELDINTNIFGFGKINASRRRKQMRQIHLLFLRTGRFTVSKVRIRSAKRQCPGR